MLHAHSKETVIVTIVLAVEIVTGGLEGLVLFLPFLDFFLVHRFSEGNQKVFRVREQTVRKVVVISIARVTPVTFLLKRNRKVTRNTFLANITWGECRRVVFVVVER